MQPSNPAGTLGFDFLEFSTTDPMSLSKQFQAMGFYPVGKHHHHEVTIYQQNNARFIINTTPKSMANQFALAHGASVSAMGFRVKNASEAYQHALKNGARAYQCPAENDSYGIPAIYGVGESLIYFVDYDADMSNYANRFCTVPYCAPNDAGLTYIDHVTHNLKRGHMDEWADFYQRLFNFQQIRFFDIEGKMTGLKSRAMVSPCGKIRIPLNESADDQSQIEEFIHEFKGEGIQHIALGTDQIYDSVRSLRQRGLRFLDTPDTYYELIDKRLPKHGEPIEALKQLRILIDGQTREEKKLLLQIFTENMLGPVFFEIIQRKGDEGFGEGNFRALFESIELDQIRRGVLKPSVATESN